jgi:hypothetical protein
MKTHAKRRLYQKLELIPDAMWESMMAEAKQQRSHSRFWLRRIWDFVVDCYIPTTEPRIWEKRDRHGITWWEVYDPMTGQSRCCSSKQEVRAWLEQRYYRNG